MNRNLFAHGYQQGDVVRIVAYSAHNIGDGEAGKSVGGTTAALPTECSCLVHQLEVNDPCLLALEAPQLDGLGDTDTCVQILSEVEPFNLHFAAAVPSAASHGVPPRCGAVGCARLSRRRRRSTSPTL